MSVSETPKSRLDTISFPGPAVVKAAGLNKSLWKSQHWQAMFQANTCPALPQVDPGTDRAAIGSSCSSQQTCKKNTIYNQIKTNFPCGTFSGLGGHMYLLVIMTETSLWLHTLHILTVSNHPTVKRLKRWRRSTCSCFAQRHPSRPFLPQLLFPEEQQRVREIEICFSGQPARVHFNYQTFDLIVALKQPFFPFYTSSDENGFTNWRRLWPQKKRMFFSPEPTVPCFCSLPSPLRYPGCARERLIFHALGP